MRKILCMVGVGVFLISSAARSEEAGTWEKIGDDDGIITYKKEVPGSPVIAFKGEGDIDAPVLRVGSVLVDIKRVPEWMDSVEDVAEVRKIAEDEYIEYDHIGTPFVMKDREFVTDNKLAIDLDKHLFTITAYSVEDDKAPKTSYIRGKLINGVWQMTSIDGGKRTHMVAEMHADPMGSVPKWIINLFQKGWARNTIQSIRKQVAKKDVVDHPDLKAAFEKRGFH